MKQGDVYKLEGGLVVRVKKVHTKENDEELLHKLLETGEPYMGYAECEAVDCRELKSIKNVILRVPLEYLRQGERIKSFKGFKKEKDND